MFRLLKFLHSGQGIDELLDLILIQSELMELKASAKRKVLLLKHV